MTTVHSTDADPAPSPSPDDPRPPEVADSSTVEVGASLTDDSHLRIDGELAGRLLRSSRWQQ